MIFDKEYFDGELVGKTLPWGYSYYKRWYGFDGINSKGEYWKDKAQYLYSRLHLKDKKVLEIGCAKGFLVADLRELGVEVWGIDISSYATSQIEEQVKKYICCSDAFLYLEELKEKSIDVIISLRFLSCLHDTMYVRKLIQHMNRVSYLQYHVIDETLRFYVQKPIQEWLEYDWKPSTILVSYETGKEAEKE